MYLLFTALRVCFFIVLFCEQQAMAIEHKWLFCCHDLFDAAHLARKKEPGEHYTKGAI